MLFTSYGFVGFVLLLLCLYYTLPRRWQKGLLLLCSLGFYALSDWRCLGFLLVTALSIFLCARKIERIHHTCEQAIAAAPSLSREEKKSLRAKSKTRARAVLLTGLCGNIGILCVTKYTNFVLRTVSGLWRQPFSPIDLLVPMGISFYTFQAVAYLIDVYRTKTQAQPSFWRFLLFVSFFPQMVQGPISRYDDLAPSLLAEHPFQLREVAFGLLRVCYGYFKKLVIADRLLPGVTSLVQGPYEGGYVFVAMILYAAELYCDFTGGIDITIGLAQMLGVRVKENFRLPFFSRSTKEYWNRWHITMGTWFTDYIFYPVSVSSPLRRLSKWCRSHLGQSVGKRVPVYLSSLIVWSATGIWHGAAWNFLAWGLCNFLVIMISQELEPLYARFHKRFSLNRKRGYGGFCVVRTILLMSCIRMFDCYRDVPLTLSRIGSMFTRFSLTGLFDGTLLRIGLSPADYGVVLGGLVLVFCISLLTAKKGDVRELLSKKPFLFSLYTVLLIVLTLVFGAYGPGYQAGQFIYNQF